MSFISYILWYISLNSYSFFTSTIRSLDKNILLSLYNQEDSKNIIHYYYIDIIQDKLVTRSSINYKNTTPSELCLFIGTGIILDNINIQIPQASTIFYLTSDKIGKREVLKRWYTKLGLMPADENFFLLDSNISDEIRMMIFTNAVILIQYTKKYKVPYGQMTGVYMCILIIFLCMVTIFFLVCGIYSSSNPIVTEIELERFKLFKYKDIKDKNIDSCLICFDNFEEEEELRVLFCNHYFHKKCVDKWLCEQSSRCPYCRYTNKYYDEI